MQGAFPSPHNPPEPPLTSFNALLSNSSTPHLSGAIFGKYTFYVV